MLLQPRLQCPLCLPDVLLPTTAGDLVNHSRSFQCRVSVLDPAHCNVRLPTENPTSRSIAHLFGVGLSTICVTVNEGCTAIVEFLSRRYIRIPASDSECSLHTWGFPQCFGVIDESHIPIITPKDNHIHYYNRKKFHSIVLQVLVDHEYKFMNNYVV